MSIFQSIKKNVQSRITAELVETEDYFLSCMRKKVIFNSKNPQILRGSKNLISSSELDIKISPYLMAFLKSVQP